MKLKDAYSLEVKLRQAKISSVLQLEGCIEIICKNLYTGWTPSSEFLIFIWFLGELSICIFTFLGDARAAGLVTTLWEPLV